MTIVRLVQWIHWAVLIFVLTAWFWPWTAAVWVHAVFVPIMLIHWKTNENRCVLSDLEEKFKSGAGASSIERVQAEESQFIRMACTKIFGKAPSDEALDNINWIVSGLVWVLSVLRLMFLDRTF